MDLIVTHQTNNGRAEDLRELTYRELLLRARVNGGLEPTLPPDGQYSSKSLRAFINHGMWKVQCDVCNTAVAIDLNDLVFYCPGCGVDNKWRRVKLPADGKRAEIERLLLLREGYRHNAPTRNWLPQETLTQLRDENRAHGLEV